MADSVVQVGPGDARWMEAVGGRKPVRPRPWAGDGMQQAGVSEGPLFGFLTVVDAAANGLFGGFLVVDDRGRPVEFFCTAPMKVTRAQQILYGPTLHGHFHGRQIGGALLAEARTPPVVVLTDQETLLQVRPHTTLPVALVQRAAGDGSSPGLRVGAAVVGPTDADAARESAIHAQLVGLGGAVDLCEPFERIRQAIEEAQRH